jgi:prephenate dehydrogenase
MQRHIEETTIGLVGLGIMGGALALALGQLNPKAILAYDINQNVLNEAMEKKIITRGYEDPVEMLSQADLVIVGINPRQGINFIIEHMGDFKENCLLADIMGIKTMVIEEIHSVLRDDIDYIPGHPMAGSEKEGFSHAKDVSFKGKNYILTLTERNHADNVTFYEDIIRGMGFTNIVYTSPQIHDQKIAFTSQLCHLIAAALVDSEKDLNITDFEGGSFGDLTRIAMINAEMWTELFVLNKKYLIDQIEKFEKSLDIMKNMIAEDESEELIKRLHSVREKRILMDRERKERNTCQ